MRFGRVLLVSLIMALATIWSVGPVVAAAQSEWSKNDQGAVRLLSAVERVGDSGRVQLGLVFKLNPGWKIYWRSPGDAGYPPAIDWKGSDNLAEAVVSWPVPHRFSFGGFETLGYSGEVVLPIIARLNDPAKALSLRAGVDYLVCDVVCVPQHANLTLDLPVGPAEASSNAHFIGRFLARVPGDGASRGLSLIKAEATDGGALRVVVEADPPLQKPDLFIERADQMQFRVPKVKMLRGGRQVVFEVMPVPGTGEGELDDKPVTLTIADGDRGMEVVTDIAPSRPETPLGPLAPMLGIALLGGLILNLMPCVLPVLSIKILSLVGLGGSDRGHIRASFLASAAGVLASFLVLAGGAVAVRMAGAAVGWGIQFQQPLFLTGMTFLVVLFAANLFGFYDIALPSWTSDLGGAGGRRRTLAGHFASGAFATLLATPCSAPFVGTAVGFALARGSLEILAIFVTLGIGMASPYLVVAACPQLARWLPSPGRWMLVLQRLLGMVLVATAVWLLVVLSAEAGGRVAQAVGILMVALLVFLGLGRRLVALTRVAAAALVILAALAVSSGPPPIANAAVLVHPHGLWKPFNRDAIATAVGEGKVVFVDVTADWCITCQVNKAAVVYRNPVLARLTAPGVVAMQADWTSPDDSIARYLADFGRYGVPFNAVYGPGAPDGIALSELLNADSVLEALDKAAKPPA
jgi:suppressor for copper-sensitivity B